MQHSLEDAKAKEREALDKANAEMEKAKGSRRNFLQLRSKLTVYLTMAMRNT